MRPEDPYCLDCGALLPDDSEGSHVCDSTLDLPPPQITNRGRIYFAADIERARAEGAASERARLRGLVQAKRAQYVDPGIITVDDVLRWLGDDGDEGSGGV